jgi:mersacidin/lichenicidin family type 2 lantibiotic
MRWGATVDRRRPPGRDAQFVGSNQTTKERVMSRSQIIRAWKDQEYRRSLSNAERAVLPAHPAGTVEDLTDAELGAVVGRQKNSYPNKGPTIRYIVGECRAD